MRYRRLKPNEVVRRTDQVLYQWLEGNKKWMEVEDNGFRVKDCMSGNAYRRRVEYGASKRHKI